MRDKADLTDKSEELEHIIMQLQSETETIGESGCLDMLLHITCFDIEKFELCTTH